MMVQALMRPLVVVIVKILFYPYLQFLSIFSRVQVYIFPFECSPESFNIGIVRSSSFTIHTDNDILVFQIFYPSWTSKLGSLVLPGTKNTVKMGMVVQQNREQEYSKNGNKNTVISINIINQGLHCIINKKQDCDGLKNKITYHYVSRDSQAS